jgi:hypothetical protein
MVVVSVSKLLDDSPAENSLKYDRYDALPTNRQEFMDMFVDSVTGDLIVSSSAQAYAWVIHSTISATRISIPPQEEHIEKVPITSIQYTEYIKARVKERRLEDRWPKKV